MIYKNLKSAASFSIDLTVPLAERFNWFREYFSIADGFDWLHEYLSVLLNGLDYCLVKKIF